MQPRRNLFHRFITLSFLGPATQFGWINRVIIPYMACIIGQVMRTKPICSCFRTIAKPYRSFPNAIQLAIALQGQQRLIAQPIICDSIVPNKQFTVLLYIAGKQRIYEIISIRILFYNKKLYQPIFIIIITLIMIIPIWDNLKPITIVPQSAREKIIHCYFDGIFQRAGYSLMTPQNTTSAKKTSTKKKKQKKRKCRAFLIDIQFPTFCVS